MWGYSRVWELGFGVKEVQGTMNSKAWGKKLLPKKWPRISKPNEGETPQCFLGYPLHLSFPITRIFQHHHHPVASYDGLWGVMMGWSLKGCLRQNKIK